ncbi:MAG: ATP-binding protein, partial [Armatimonadetes bacterium]|nr:ATP-binding protein [Armatimonadota bacterium]
SLDLPSEAEQADRDPRGFLMRHPPPLVVDEVQYAPGLFRHIKATVDSARDKTGQFILTGSQKLTLMRSVSESLAGRADILELETLSFHEIHRARPDLIVEEVLFRGGFPELYARPEIDAAGFYRSYVATYLERDLRLLLQVTSLRDYERFLRACALRSAQLLNRADLARDVGVAGSTLGGWMSVLEASGIAALLTPWHSNRTKSLVKTPKLYLCDAGLCAFLVGIPRAIDLLASPLAGALWETLVFSEIRKRQVNARGGWNLHFWRDRNREVDFLIHEGGLFNLAEAKWTEHPDERDAEALLRVASELPRGQTRGLSVIGRAANPYPITAKVEALPLSEVQRWAE